MTALLVTLMLTAAPAERPHLVASVRVSTFTGLPDVLGASATLHVIPWVDLEGGASAFVFSRGWYARGGPRWLFEDWRDEANRGLTLRLSALAGVKSVTLRDSSFLGFHFAAAVELTYWLASHLGLTLQLSGGGTVRAWPAFFPELRLAWGAGF
ncbi:MAG: hypothetical protein JNJ54_14125 [Myxococcaceae bacterium]|nr:hypothetical protein [Myxococcaceae bacterium]